MKQKHKRSDPVWLFDLDNTLHNASHAIFPAVNAQMNAYMARVLGDGVNPADPATVNAARLLYWRRYGATLMGLIKHHGVNADEFLHEAHTFPDLSSMIRAERGLASLFKRLPGRKILLTNAPRKYARDVVRHLGLQRQFAEHIPIEDMRVHGKLRPKPSRRYLRKLLVRLKVSAGRCVLVEDTVANLRAAKRLGMRTVLVTRYLPRQATAPGKSKKSAACIDVTVKSVQQLPDRRWLNH